MSREMFSGNLRNRLHSDEWLIWQDQYEAKENLKYESLFALSNGYLGIRGSHEEGTKITLPYLYINGVFDKSETFMRELSTLPNWLGIRLYVEKELIGIEDCEILEFSRVLDMKGAFLGKRVRLKDSKGRETLIEGIRFVSRNNVHRMGIRLYVTPLNYSGIIEVESIIDGTIINFYDAPRFKVKHTYMTANEKLAADGCYVEVATRENHLHVGCGCRIEAYADGKQILGNRMISRFGEQSVEFGDIHVEEGKEVEIVKYVSMYTERECPAYALHTTIEKEIEGFVETGFDQELKAHEDVYKKMWENADIQITGDDELNRAVRFNIFHLMSTGNEHDDHVNVGAKLLTGDPIVPDTHIRKMTNGKFTARALDDRLGVYIIMEAIKRAKELGCKVGVYGASTTGEETTKTGAFWTSTRINPTLAIVVDVTYTSDCSGMNPAEMGTVLLGGGPVLCNSPIVVKTLNAKMEECAKKVGIPVQREAASRLSYTDGDKIHFSNQGVPMVLVSIPLRYMHMPAEVADEKDVEGCVELIAQFLANYNA